MPLKAVKSAKSAWEMILTFLAIAFISLFFLLPKIV